MSYAITPSEDGKYILIKMHGDMTRALAMQQNIEAHQLGKELGVNRYLTDLIDSTNVDSVINDYEFAYADMQTEPDIDRYARVAILVRPDDHSHDFIEVLATNAGLNVKLFRDREQAIAHLTKDEGLTET